MESSLVQTNTKDGLLLQGYFNQGPPDKSVLLHIHGYAGNFYENHFIQVIDKHIKKANLSFLTVNTRGCEYIKEFNTVDGDLEMIGARYELLEEAYLDIDAWIEFLVKNGYKEIILQGHSLGTMKVVRYLSEGNFSDYVKRLILLAPFDKKAMLEKHTDYSIEELKTIANKFVKEEKGEEIISGKFESIDISYSTWLSWYAQDDLGRMFEFSSKNYNFPVLEDINIPVKVIVGTKDEYFHLSNPEHPEEAADMIKKHLHDCEILLIEGANHQYSNFEDLVGENVVSFMSQ